MDTLACTSTAVNSHHDDQICAYFRTEVTEIDLRDTTERTGCCIIIAVFSGGGGRVEGNKTKTVIAGDSSDKIRLYHEFRTR